MRNLLALTLLSAVPGMAIVTTDDPSNHVVNAGSVFDGVGALTRSGSNCTATLLSSGIHVLTAAHCVTASGTTNPFAADSFTVRFDLAGGSQTYTGSSLFVHPTYSPVGQPGYTGDLAILLLDQMVDAAAQRYALHTGLEGGTTYLVGYGRQGVGTTGSVPGSGVTKLVGLNEIEAADITSGLLLFDFDSGDAANNVFGTLGLGVDESMTAPGDSGGPAFIFSSGAYRIVGVNVVVACASLGTLDYDGSCTAQTNPGPNSSFGEIGGATRISLYSDWIQGVVDIPEPGTFVLAGLGLVLAGMSRRRK